MKLYLYIGLFIDESSYEYFREKDADQTGNAWTRTSPKKKKTT